MGWGSAGTAFAVGQPRPAPQRWWRAPPRGALTARVADAVGVSPGRPAARAGLLRAAGGRAARQQAGTIPPRRAHWSGAPDRHKKKKTRHARVRTRTDVRRGEAERRGAVARLRTHTRRRTGRARQPRASTGTPSTEPPLRRCRRPGRRRAGRPPRRTRTARQRASEGEKKDGLGHGDFLGDAGASSHSPAPP